MGLETALRGRWMDLCSRCGFDDRHVLPQGRALIAAYGESHRHYHGVTHLRECLDVVDAMVDLGSEDRVAAQFSLWFHDVVYVAVATDNERLSATMAISWLDHVGYQRSAEVGRLIEMTAGHDLPADGDEAARAVHDADLAILGANEARYDEYALQIRLEYRHLTDAEFASGRRKVLESFLNAHRIYARPDTRAERENQARTNMAREVQRLDL